MYAKWWRPADRVELRPVSLSRTLAEEDSSRSFVRTRQRPLMTGALPAATRRQGN